MRKPLPSKPRKPRRNFFDFTSKLTPDSKTSQLELHLGALFDHGVNFRDRIITLTGEVNSDMFSLVDAALSEMEAHSRKAITIRINSEGGGVYDALAIVGRIKSCKCKVVTEGFGCIMSAATLILACGEERRISSLAWFMSHESSYSVTGRHKEVMDFVKQSEREEQQWAARMAEHSNEDSKFWREVHANADAYFDAEQLMSMGVVDEII